MNVLIVDDQINVVSGIIFGVDWDKLKISGIYKAYNALEAKNILLCQTIDIMLCDIEMPAEDGIALLKWVRKQGMETECIFLTSHADFIYAKSAMQLGCFDYILQPARYSDIENCIIRVKQKIARERENKKYYMYGKLYYDERGKIEDAIVADWYKNPLSTKSFEKMHNSIFQQNGIETGESACTLFLLNILKWTGQGEWDMDLLKYSCHNILVEIFESIGKRICLHVVDEGVLIGYFWQKDGKYEQHKERELMEHFLSVAKDFFGYNIAAYMGQPKKTDQLDIVLENLKELKENDVILKARVHTEEKDNTERNVAEEILDYKIWLSLMQKGFGKRVYGEAIDYLDKMVEENRLTVTGLRKFYNEFMKLVYALETNTQFSIEDAFGEKEQLNRALAAYQSVDDMKDFIKHITAYFCEDTDDSENTGGQIEKIKQYVYQNLDKDIRRDDIALEVFLNPNYISRLFKKHEGISLKEFIVIEKMKTAQSLIRTTDLPISIIAVRVGYSNFSHFSQVYKKVFGVSPTEERK